MELDVDTIKKKARVAGLLYLLVGIIAPIGLVVVPGKLIVRGDAAETARRFVASEGLFRLGVASEIVSSVLWLFVVLALYQLFEEVDGRMARLMVILGAILEMPVALLNVVNSIAAMTLFKGGGFLAGVDQGQLEALGMLFLRLRYQGLMIASIFWGLWLFPFGLLVIRSGFIPRFLGVLLFIAGFAYLANAFAALVVPAWEPYVGKVAMALEPLELSIILWLAIWGARPRRHVRNAPAALAAG